MKPGDMHQIETWEIQNAKAWRSFFAMAAALVALLTMSMTIGIGIGFLIWGI